MIEIKNKKRQRRSELSMGWAFERWKIEWQELLVQYCRQTAQHSLATSRDTIQ